MDVLTAQEMRDLEAAAIASGAVTGLALMERAGQGVVEAAFEEWPEMAAGAHRAVVLCGPGNNGGDGFVVARLLKARGWEVAVFFYGVPDRLPPDARVNYERVAQVDDFCDLGYPQVTVAASDRFCDIASKRFDIAHNPAEVLHPPFLMVDALFGIGLKRPLSGLAKIPEHWDYLCRFRDLNDTRIVAVDVPSGVETDSGDILWGGDTPFAAFGADLTVTFHRAKPCHRISQLCGKVVIKDIGL